MALPVAQSALSSPDYTVWQLNVDQILIDLEHDLRGETWDPKAKDWKAIQAGDEAMLNEMGIRETISVVRTHVNKESLMSSFEANEILGICRKLHRALKRHYFFNWNKYEIKESNLPIVIHKVTHFVFMCLKCAEKGGMRNLVGQTEKVNRIIAENQKDTDKRLWS